MSYTVGRELPLRTIDAALSSACVVPCQGFRRTSSTAFGALLVTKPEEGQQSCRLSGASLEKR